MFRSFRLPFLVLTWALVGWLQSCTCCVYLNHQFNAERALDEGAELQQARQDSTPSDSTIVTADERKKFDRAVEKGSRVLERFPEDMTYKPRALWVIAESFRRKGEWARAIVKYDELQRYFEGSDSIPAAEYWQAWCLWRNREYALARFALERVLAKGESHSHYADALALSSLLDEQADNPEAAIAALEKILAQPGGAPYMRARARLRLAELYYRLENWPKAHSNFISPDLASLSDPQRLDASIKAADCLGKQQMWEDEVRFLSALLENPIAEKRKVEVEVLLGEAMLHTAALEDGVDMLLTIARAQRNSELGARAWFAVGDHYQMTRQDYPKAVVNYDSSFGAMPSSRWGKLSQERRESIRKLLAAREKQAAPGTRPSAADEFLIAELFLFRLDRVDSALRTLDRIIDSMPVRDTALVARAAYARAFITAEFAKDSSKADSLYRKVVESYPGTEFAQRAQVNLGQRVTIRTRADEAHDALLVAEATYDRMKSLAADSAHMVDSLFSLALQQYDSVARTWPETREAPKAIYARAWIYENEAQNVDSAKMEYLRLLKPWGKTEWGIAAREKMNPRLSVSDVELERLRKRLAENEKSAVDARKRYEEVQKKEEVKRKQKAADADDEVLEDDYNSMYNFQ